jgi:hypothetical protein
MSESICIPEEWAEHLASRHQDVMEEQCGAVLTDNMLIYIRDEYPEIVVKYPGVFEDVI